MAFQRVTKRRSLIEERDHDSLQKGTFDGAAAPVPAQPSGSRPEMRELFHEGNMKTWSPGAEESPAIGFFCGRFLRILSSVVR